MIALENPAYGELLLHPPPLCVLTIPFFLCCCTLPQSSLEVISKYYSYFMFWFENIFFIIAFIVQVTLLVPLVYIKNLFTIVWASSGLFTTLFYAVGWLFVGLFITLFLAVRDVYYYMKILAMHRGCREAYRLEDELKEEAIDSEVEVKIFNETRETVIDLYFDIKNQILKIGEG